MKRQIKEAAEEEGADLVGFVGMDLETVVILGYAGEGHNYLKGLDERTRRVARRIQEAGFRASIISACDGNGISLRRLAEEAGLGFIGRSGLLITERFGPDVRFAGIRTSTKLALVKKEKTKERCNGCSLCLVSCPADAIKNRDVERCRGYVTMHDKDRCTACIDVCPFGRAGND
ncbi:MAG: 4Fe-4S binding protein [Candidatus Hydrothermarchaeales archaeon]